MYQSLPAKGRIRWGLIELLDKEIDDTARIAGGLSLACDLLTDLLIRTDRPAVLRINVLIELRAVAAILVIGLFKHFTTEHKTWWRRGIIVPGILQLRLRFLPGPGTKCQVLILSAGSKTRDG